MEAIMYIISHLGSDTQDMTQKIADGWEIISAVAANPSGPHVQSGTVQYILIKKD